MADARKAEDAPLTWEQRYHNERRRYDEVLEATRPIEAERDRYKAALEEAWAEFQRGGIDTVKHIVHEALVHENGSSQDATEKPLTSG